jgi:hypothetical protein
VKNTTRQKNEAWAGNAPIVSGNNLVGSAARECGQGGQSSSVGTDQQQFNGNWTYQSATQTGRGCCTCCTCCTSSCGKEAAIRRFV